MDSVELKSSAVVSEDRSKDSHVPRCIDQETGTFSLPPERRLPKKPDEDEK